MENTTGEPEPRLAGPEQPSQPQPPPPPPLPSTNTTTSSTPNLSRIEQIVPDELPLGEGDYGAASEISGRQLIHQIRRRQLLSRHSASQQQRNSRHEYQGSRRHDGPYQTLSGRDMVSREQTRSLGPNYRPILLLESSPPLLSDEARAGHLSAPGIATVNINQDTDQYIPDDSGRSAASSALSVGRCRPSLARYTTDIFEPMDVIEADDDVAPTLQMDQHERSEGDSRSIRHLGASHIAVDQTEMDVDEGFCEGSASATLGGNDDEDLLNEFEAQRQQALLRFRTSRQAAASCPTVVRSIPRMRRVRKHARRRRTSNDAPAEPSVAP